MVISSRTGREESGFQCQMMSSKQRDVQTHTNTRIGNAPDILSGQEVQQLGHVSGQVAQLHGELADAFLQHQSAFHTLPHQVQLHVSAAHHHRYPAGGVA